MSKSAFLSCSLSPSLKVAIYTFVSLMLNENLVTQTNANLLTPSFSNQTATQSAGDLEDDFAPRVVVTKKLPALKNIAARSIEDADLILRDNELVLGVVINGRARAYPINMLTGPTREIINDELNGVSISATW